MRPAACPICESPRVELLRARDMAPDQQVSFSYTFSPEASKTLQVLVCRECTHGFCHPLPPNFAAGYKDVVDAEYLQHAPSRRYSYARILRDVQRRYGTGALVDIGCATGDLLAEARSLGFAPCGVEPSDWSAAIAQERGFDVFRGFLAEASTAMQSQFRYATLLGVIEHFEDPKEQVKHIHSLLAPGGRIVIWTGDRTSLTARLLGRKWWYWQGQHIQYFTQASLTRLLRECGFQHVEHRLYPFGATTATLLNSLRRYRSLALLRPVIRALLRLLPAVWPLKLPGEMLCIAQRD